ncbi:MAG: phytoene desaturase family protein [Candidatus Methylomirabilales bacterium]
MNWETDCLIVGSGVGSLTCGTILAQRGWRVLLLTERPLAESFSWAQNGFEHDRTPELYWGLEEEGFLGQLLASQGSGPAPLRLTPGVQVVLPRHRLGFYPLGPEWERELRREFPRSWDAILKCSEQLCHEALSGRTQAAVGSVGAWNFSRFIRGRRLQTFLDRRDLDPAFSQMLKALTVACFRVEPSQTTVTMAAMALGHLQRGLFALAGGARELTERLASQFHGLGGEIHMGTVAAVRTKWRQIQGVTTAEGDEVSCRYAVVEPEQTPGKRILHLLVDEVFIPGQMRQNVLVVETDSQERTPGGLLHLALGNAGNADDPQGGKRSVGLRVLQASQRDPIILLERAFAGWGTARIVSAPPLRESSENFLLSRGRRGLRNLLIISHETPLGSGLCATAWSGYNIGVRLASQT